MSNNISYSEYLAENLDKNIKPEDYCDDNQVSYGSYLCIELDKSISYSEYLAENISVYSFTDNLNKIIENVENGE
jgi:hypothetical protein